MWFNMANRLSDGNDLTHGDDMTLCLNEREVQFKLFVHLFECIVRYSIYILVWYIVWYRYGKV